MRFQFPEVVDHQLERLPAAVRPIRDGQRNITLHIAPRLLDRLRQKGYVLVRAFEAVKRSFGRILIHAAVQRVTPTMVAPIGPELRGSAESAGCGIYIRT